jgi:hypothetical protein
MFGHVYADGPQRRQGVTETTIHYDDRHIHRRVSCRRCSPPSSSHSRSS